MKCDNCQEPLLKCQCPAPILYGIDVREALAGLASIGRAHQAQQLGQEDLTTGAGLMPMKETLAAIWPNPAGRPCIQTWHNWRDAGIIPYVKIGRRVYYDPEECRRAIDKKHKIA